MMVNSYLSLNSIGKITTGKTPSTADEQNFSNDYPFITPSDIPTFSEKYIFDTERGISLIGAQKLNGYLLPANTVCMVCIGSTIGKMCLTKTNSFTNQQINSLIVNKNYNPHYIFYLLRFVRSYFQLIGAGTGSGKGIVNKTTYGKSKFPIIEDLYTQNRIASILSMYDKLIEKNNCKIAILQEQAQELYKEWFVRFRFPGHEFAEYTDSCFGKIPSSFSVINMQEAFSYYKGGGWGADENDDNFSKSAYVIRGTDFPKVICGDLTTCPLRYHKPSNYEARKIQANDIIIEVSGGTAKQPVGRTIIINQQIIDRFNNSVICASFCKLIRLNKQRVTPLFFYYWMQFLYDTRIIDKFQLQSTGIINFKFEYFLRKGNIVLPPMEIMKQFENLVSPMSDEMNKLAVLNDSLTQQRDLLLPRLMSGKLEVGDSKQKFKVVSKTNHKQTFGDFLQESKMAARGQDISMDNLRAIYEAINNDTQQEE